MLPPQERINVARFRHHDRVLADISPTPRGSHGRLRPLSPSERPLQLFAKTPGARQTKLRLIKRWENEDVLDRMQARLDRMPDAMSVRWTLR
jgi:hypothetical protein